MTKTISKRKKCKNKKQFLLSTKKLSPITLPLPRAKRSKRKLPRSNQRNRSQHLFNNNKRYNQLSRLIQEQ